MVTEAWVASGAKPNTQPLQVDESVLELMRRHGASEEDLALAEEVMRKQQGEGDVECEVWPENWAHWNFFMRVNAHWVHTGWTGLKVALDFPAIEVIAKALGFRGKAWGQLVEDLLVIEQTALNAWAERSKREADG